MERLSWRPLSFPPDRRRNSDHRYYCARLKKISRLFWAGRSPSIFQANFDLRKFAIFRIFQIEILDIPNYHPARAKKSN
jgi:hypothetical protein